MTDDRAVYDLFHETLDRIDVSGPFQRLRLELETPGAPTRRHGRRILMTRNRMALLAAVLVLLLGVTVVLGARAMNALHPVGQTINAGPDDSAVAQLLARPLNLQHRSTSIACPDGPFGVDGDYGSGPVYGVGGSNVSTSWGTYWSVGLLVDKNTKGPIIMRGEDIVLGWPLVFLGPIGSGPVYGYDTLDGKRTAQYTLIVLDTSHPPQNWLWQFQQGFKHSWSGCVGFQVDGPGFSEQFYSAGETT